MTFAPSPRILAFINAYGAAGSEKDTARLGDNLSALLGSVPTTQGQYDAMFSLASEIGQANFAKSALLRKHRDGDTYGASLEFLNWTFEGGKRSPSLLKRRKGEALIYRGALT